MANVLVISETPQRVIIRDEAATRTVKVVAQGPQGPAGSVNPMMFTLRDQAQASADSAAIDASTAQSSSASAFASANAAAGSAASVLASQQAAATSATQAATSASQAATSATSAGTSATNAQTSATSATASAASAQASAQSVIDKANIADAAAASATNSAATATTKATEAATSATNAAGSATSASTSATTATTKATQASTSATLAQDWAIKTVDPVSGAEYSSKYHAQAASASAGSASSSATAAAASATTAGTKAGEASASAASALDSKDVASVAAQFAVNAQSAAQTSASAALASKNAAATSATSASDSATAASNSATAAAGSATSAGNSATGASSSAVTAAGSAATATTKASEASTSATNAAASATAAATSATNAANSATAAAASATNTANALVGERSAVATLTNKTITSPVIDSGAANGVAYLNGSKVLTAGAGLTFDGSKLLAGNVSGLGQPQRIQAEGSYLAYGDGAGFRAVNETFTGGGGITANAAAGEGITITGDGGNIAFVAGGSEKMRLTSTGLGIGTSSPYSRLTVIPSADASSPFEANQITVGEASGNAAFRLQLGYFLAPGFVWSGSIQAVRSDVPTPLILNGAGGAVGIGTTSPATLLDVRGTGDPTIRVVADTGGTASLDLTSYGVYAWKLHANAALSFARDSTELMRLDVNGNLGIGTSSPGAPLDVVTNNVAAGVSLRGRESDSASDLSFKSNTAGATYGQIQGRSTDLRLQANSIPITFYTGGGETMRLDASGNLGLGVAPSANSIPGSVVQVGPAGFIGKSFSPTNNQAIVANNVTFGDGGAVNYGAYSDSATMFRQLGGQFQWYTAPSGTAGQPISFTNAMTLDASGNLLVGKTTSGYTLDGVEVAGAGAVTITRSSGTCIDLNRKSDGGVIDFYRSGSYVGGVSITTTATSYNTSSDYRLKNITGPITNSGAYIDSLNPVEGSWKADGSTFVGLIAHEVQEASRTQVATGVKDGEEMQAMDYSASELIANMIAELKSLRARVAALENN